MSPGDHSGLGDGDSAPPDGDQALRGEDHSLGADSPPLEPEDMEVLPLFWLCVASQDVKYSSKNSDFFPANTVN